MTFFQSRKDLNFHPNSGRVARSNSLSNRVSVVCKFSLLTLLPAMFQRYHLGVLFEPLLLCDQCGFASLPCRRNKFKILQILQNQLLLFILHIYNRNELNGFGNYSSKEKFSQKEVKLNRVFLLCCLPLL